MDNLATFRRWLISKLSGTPARSRGIALVAVLWIVTSLTVLVLSFNASVRSHLDVSSSELSIAHSEAAIEAAVRLAVLKLREPDKKAKWASDGRAYDVALIGRNVRIAIQDLKGLIDLNGASPELLTGLIKRHVDSRGQAVALATRIIDWRDPDHEVSQGGGAEDAAYANAGLKGAGDRPFADITELSRVLGISEQLSQRLAPHLTIYGSKQSKPPKAPAANPSQQPPPTPAAPPPTNKATPGSGTKINVMTAPRSVLQALPNITEGTIDRIITLRKRVNIAPQTLLASLSQWPNLVTAGQPGPAYRLRIDVTDPALVPAAAEVTVLLLPQSKQPYHILEWQSARPLPR